MATFQFLWAENSILWYHSPYYIIIIIVVLTAVVTTIPLWSPSVTRDLCLCPPGRPRAQGPRRCHRTARDSCKLNAEVGTMKFWRSGSQNSPLVHMCQISIHRVDLDKQVPRDHVASPVRRFDWDFSHLPASLFQKHYFAVWGRLERLSVQACFSSRSKLIRDYL